jgi:hypothetical protein
MTQSPSLAMSLQMGLEVECLLVLRNPPSSSNPGSEQRTIHQHTAEEFNAYMETVPSGERMVVEESLQASTTAQVEAKNGFEEWTVGDDISVQPDDENTTQGKLPFTNLSPLGPFDRNILSQCTCAMFSFYECRF